jgi:predicted nucleic acid-binding protein
MSFVVLDTDAASHVFRGRVNDAVTRHLAGATLAVTFVTVGELTKWTLVRRWGPSRLAKLQSFLADVVVLPYSISVATTWGDLQAHAQLRGRPRPANDTWVAACCLLRELPLLTFNHKDFQDFSYHEGLALLPVESSG